MPLSSLLLILSTVSLSAFAQLALKLGTTSHSVKAASGQGALTFLMAVAATPAVWIGLAIYGASVALWLWVLSKTELSVAYPFVGLSFFVTMVFGAIFLREDIGPARIAGTLLIVAGCVMVARSA